MMSRTSSMPTDRRTNSGVTPVCACSSGVSCECVVVAGWMISDLASPMLARWLNSLTLLISLTPASLPPLMPKPTIAPWPVGKILLRVGVIGMAGQARIVHPRHGRMLLQELRHGQGVLRVPLHAAGAASPGPAASGTTRTGSGSAPVSRSQWVRMWMM